MHHLVAIATLTLTLTLATLVSGDVVSDSEASACANHMREISSVRQSLVVDTYWLVMSRDTEVKDFANSRGLRESMLGLVSQGLNMFLGLVARKSQVLPKLMEKLNKMALSRVPPQTSAVIRQAYLDTIPLHLSNYDEQQADTCATAFLALLLP